MSIFEQLAAPFPPQAVSWRAQTLTGDGSKAMALCYIDARDVMRRLDEVCGPDGWQDSYHETAKGRLLCTIEILCGDVWIRKSDGAGDTDVEGEKGAISDAFKRAAVKWGIGRYLYDVDAIWAECESTDKNGKKYWKKWTPNGKRQLDAVFNKFAQSNVPEMVTDSDRDKIAPLAEAAGVSLQTICERAEVRSLKELTAEQAASVIKKLHATIESNKRKAA